MDLFDLRRVKEQKSDLLNDMIDYLQVNNIYNLITDSEQAKNVVGNSQSTDDVQIEAILKVMRDKFATNDEDEEDEEDDHLFTYNNFKREYEGLKDEENQLRARHSERTHSRDLRLDTSVNAQVEPPPPTVPPPPTMPPALRSGVRCDLAPGTPGCSVSGGKKRKSMKRKSMKPKSKKSKKSKKH
jgi:hypothetical protein